MRYFYIILVLFVLYLKSSKIDAVKYNPISITECEDGDRYHFLEYRKIGDKGEKAWFGNVTFPFEVDPNAEFNWEMRWWKNGDWEKKAQTFKGKVCFYLQKFAAKLWKQVREAVKPPVTSDCPVPKGTYTAENMVLDYGDVNLPMVKKGKFRGKITVAKDGKAVCLVLTAELI